MDTLSKNSAGIKLIEKADFIWRPKWFLVTRFIAIMGVMVTLAISYYLFRITTIQYTALWILTAILLVSNVIYCYFYKKLCFDKNCSSPLLQYHLTVFTLIQINVDLVILTLMLHFGGGATNPFVFYYFFHTILSSILLSKNAAYIEAFIAAFLFNGITLLEGFGIIKHHTLLCPGCHSRGTFISGMCFAMTSALFIAVYMATSIMERLRKQQKELVHSLQETERLEIEKSHFLDVVAHDLKSPLASIETMVTSALSVYGDEIPEKCKHVMQRIPYHTNKLLKFIQELLDFSKIKNIDTAQVQFKLLDILPIVSSTLEMHMPQALEKNITVNLHSDPDIPAISGNSDYLEQMTANLLSNAIRYTPENGSVDITITSEDNEIIMTVADTGIGIPEDSLSKIFDDFFRTRNARMFNSSGTGLGLSIVKSIVEKHGGTISVSSIEGKGTVFTVHLPAVPSKNSA